jgi:hypothetical protein
MKVTAHFIISLIAFVAVPPVVFAQVPPAAQTPALTTPATGRDAVIQQITVRGTVEAVDHAARIVRVRGEQGNIVTLDVPASATRFNEVKVGQVVTISYYDRVNVRPKPAGEPDVDRVVPAATTSTPGLLPSGTRASERVTTVTIDAWDPATRILSFRTPSGQSYTRRVSETLDASLLAGIKVGDRVDVTRTDAVSVQVEAMAAPTTQAAPASMLETLRDRLTISFLWGPDNGMDGNALKSGSGLVGGTTPILLDQQSFNDIYGRFDLFKIGVGWRLSPRAEATFNFVFSQSDGESRQVGTIGVENAPLSMAIDDYSYWGLEGGQRFYFARVRFTPFLGYNVGINRISQIDGHFMAPAINEQPALDIPDGPIFDDSWALSLGPLGGVLVGLGPVELQAEIGVRYMGGLQEVEFIDSDLSNVNTDTTRWSWPFLIGARVRF